MANEIIIIIIIIIIIVLINIMDALGPGSCVSNLRLAVLPLRGAPSVQTSLHPIVIRTTVCMHAWY